MDPFDIQNLVNRPAFLAGVDTELVEEADEFLIGMLKTECPEILYEFGGVDRLLERHDQLWAID
jgi:hypothetical protein